MQDFSMFWMCLGFLRGSLDRECAEYLMEMGIDSRLIVNFEIALKELSNKALEIQYGERK